MKIDVVIFILSIAIYIFSFITFVKKENKKEITWRYILIILLFLLLGSVLMFDVLSRMKFSFDVVRNITTFLSLVIALVSFVTSVHFTNKTAKINKENKNSDFVMSLMKNHYDLMNSKSGAIDKLMDDLKNQFEGNMYIIDRSVDEFRTHLSYQKPSIKEKLGAIETAIESSDKKKLLSSEYEKFKKIINVDNPHDAITRLFITYYLDVPEHKSLFDKISTSTSNKKFNSEFIQLLKMDNGFFELLDSFMADKKTVIMKDLKYDDIFTICNKLFDDVYKDVGHFFRNSYRVFKLINEFYKEDVVNKNNYQGILRSQYSENVILAIYYNSVFTTKGLGYARELISSDFFGSTEDLLLDDPLHFRKDNLFFLDKDLKVMKSIFVSQSNNTLTIESLEDLKKKMKNTFDYA